MNEERFLREIQDYYFYEDVKRELSAVARIKAAEVPTKPGLVVVRADGSALPAARLTPGVIFLFWRQYRPDLLETLNLDKITDLWCQVSRSIFDEAPTPVGPRYFSLPPSMRERPLEDLCIKYPVVFRSFERPEYDANYPISHWGIEFSQVGWAVILDEFCSWLDTQATEYKRHGFPEAQVPIITQVKEKFGALRISVSNVPDNIWVEARDRQSEATQTSTITCMKCGQPGSLRKTAWAHVACDSCESALER